MVKKIKLRSTVLGLMPARRPDGEIRQTLTVLWDGRVWFKGETYTSVNRNIRKSIGMEKAREVLDLVDNYINGKCETYDDKLNGEWLIDLTYDDREIVDEVMASFIGARIDEEKLRELVGIDDMMLFNNIR
ncbi:MAG: hypothetical protein ACI4WM_09250 [Erysipelotrichaceae bacterium]